MNMIFPDGKAIFGCIELAEPEVGNARTHVETGIVWVPSHGRAIESAVPLTKMIPASAQALSSAFISAFVDRCGCLTRRGGYGLPDERSRNTRLGKSDNESSLDAT